MNSERLLLSQKGQIGSDADITMFDPIRVIDRATFDEPMRYSEGIQFVLVGGVPVVRDGTLVTGVFPGRAVRGANRVP